MGAVLALGYSRMMHQDRWYAIILLLSAMISVQFGSVVAKQLFPLLGPAATTVYRCGIAAVLLFAIWRPWHERLPRAAWLALLRYGAALGLMNLTFYLAIARIPFGIAVAIEFVGPLTVALFASRRRLDFVWALLAAVGILLVLPLDPAAADRLDPLGVGFALAAGICWGLYIVCGKDASSYLPGGRATAFGMAVATFCVLPFGAATASAKFFDGSLWPLLLAMGVLSSAIPYSLEMSALKRVPAKTFGILMSLQPACAALTGFLMLAENLSAIQVVAIACVVIASVGSSVTAATPAELRRPEVQRDRVPPG